MKRASKRTAKEKEWFQTVAKAFQAVCRDAQGIAQGAKDLPSDGMLARFSQWETEIDRLSPDNSTPMADGLIRVIDALRGLAWWQKRIPAWTPITQQGEFVAGFVADGLAKLQGETLREKRQEFVDLICRQLGRSLGEASAARAVEAERRAERLIAEEETAQAERAARAEGARDALKRQGQKIYAAAKNAERAAEGAEREAKGARVAAEDTRAEVNKAKSKAETDVEGRKRKGRGVRGKNIPPDVKTAVLGWMDKEYPGGVRGEGWLAVFESLTRSKDYTPRIQQHIGSVAALRRVVEAARKAAKRPKPMTRGQKK